MEEMCVNYIHYYPRTQLELCKSHVEADYLQKYFSFINRYSRYQVLQDDSHVHRSPLSLSVSMTTSPALSTSFHPH